MRNTVNIQTFPDCVWLCYRRRVDSSESDFLNRRYDVFCAAVRSETEAIELEENAAARNYLVLRESIPFLVSNAGSSDIDQIYIVFQGGLGQDDPEALSFSDPVGIVAFQSKSDCASYLSNSDEFDWNDVWEITFPWISPYALSTFPLKRRSSHSEDVWYSD